MRKPAFCICENKDADQLRGNREADQRLCFRYIDSIIPLISKSEVSSSSYLLWLYSPVCVGDRFSHNEAHIIFFMALLILTVKTFDKKVWFCKRTSLFLFRPLAR